MTKNDYISNREAAISILIEMKKPMHYLKILEAAISRNLIAPTSKIRKTPDRSFNRDLHKTIREAEEKEEEPPFKLVGRGVFEFNQQYKLSIFTEPALQKEETARDKIIGIVEEYNRKMKKGLKNIILNLDPYVFEELVTTFFAKLGYEDVEFTKKARDKGIDTIAHVKFGFNSIKVVVQTKRITTGKNISAKIAREIPTGRYLPPTPDL